MTAAAEANAKLAPRKEAKYVEGTVDEVKADVEAAQIAGEAKQAATAAPPAAKPDEEISAGAVRGIVPLEFHCSASSLASSTAPRAMAEKAKLAVVAAAAPQPNALKASAGNR